MLNAMMNKMHGSIQFIIVNHERSDSMRFGCIEHVLSFGLIINFV